MPRFDSRALPVRELRTSGLSATLTAFFATAVGVMMINVAAAQVLTKPVGMTLHISSALSGLIATVPQLGYALGMIFLVPLGDRLESRKLSVIVLLCCAVSLGVAAIAPSAFVFLVAVGGAGLTSSAIQILVPAAAALAVPAERGRLLGNIMSGVMLGILVARPLASVVADWWGWRDFYAALAFVEILLALGLWRWLPERQVSTSSRYRDLLASLWMLWRTEPVLRRHSLSAALGMAVFSAFWTAVALRLSEAPFVLGGSGIALFALVGVAGAVIAPVAGRFGDRGHTEIGKRWSHATTVVSWMVAGVAAAGWAGVVLDRTTSLLLLGIAAILLDAGIVGDQTLGRRAINLLDPLARSRFNGIFVGTFFVGGGIGALAANAIESMAGWNGVCVFCLSLSVVSLLWGMYTKTAEA